jgi:AraC-like DNA-binding protein
VLRIPPLRALAPLIAQACAGLAGSIVNWEELGLQLAGQAVNLANGASAHSAGESAAAQARVTRTLRAIERLSGDAVSLQSLATQAGLSPYHFLRTFERLTGLTPHKYLLRTRLREAALRLAGRNDRILDIALDCGFGDVSNFNRAFKAEFGVSPRVYRMQLAGSRKLARSPSEAASLDRA